MNIAFISDLHLSAARTDKLALFEHLLDCSATRVDALYILGDLFDVWVGDDDDSPAYATVIAALKRFSASGTPLYVMHGNRDFLMGNRFEAATGARLLADPQRIALQGVPTVLMHGDLLCTQDLDYQAFRKKVRDPAWQKRFLAQPLWRRKLIGRFARLRSRIALFGKTNNIMDVVQASVESILREQEASLLIHGHTHRPAIHQFEMDGRPMRRIVLGDWYAQDSVLLCTDAQQKLLRVNDYLAQVS